MDTNADTQINKLLNSEAFHVELRAWMTDCAIEPTDICQLRLTRDHGTGQRVVIAELHDGRERAFPFTTHRLH